tara:strand:- start:1626 stop:2129 length:504 start_codon:yes stop_codon:yes gene_type:complete
MGWSWDPRDWVSEVLNVFSDVTGIRELSPERVSEHETKKYMEKVAAEKKRHMTDLRRRMRSQNIRERREAQKEYNMIQKQHEKSMAATDRASARKLEQQRKAGEERLARVKEIGDGSAFKDVDGQWVGKVRSLSRLGNIGPLNRDIDVQRGTQDLPADRDKMERRPK